MNNIKKIQLSARLLLARGDDFLFGPGLMDILYAIEKLGSLRKAAVHFGMSYRWAWGRVDRAEKRLQVALLANPDSTKTGGRAKELTPEALLLMEWWKKNECALELHLLTMNEDMPAFLKK